MTPCTPKSLKKIFFSFSIRNENAKPIDKRKKSKNAFFLTPSKKYTVIKEFKDELKDFKKILYKTNN